MQNRSFKPFQPKTQPRPNHARQNQLAALSWDFLKIFFIILIVRAFMLVFEASIISIPYVDDFLMMLWNRFREIALSISNSPILPRM